MADFSFDHISIKGVYTCTSNNKKSVDELGSSMGLDENEILKFKSTTGVNQVYRSLNLTTSDYCIDAALNLMNDLDWTSEDVDVLIFVTQTPDYILPKTSAIIQHKLGLRENIFTLDINDGCSGFIYGLITAYSLCNEKHKNVLLLMGETPSKQVGLKDKSSSLLFGDGGCAIAINHAIDANSRCFISQGIDGSGYKSIIIEDGGYRNVIGKDSLKDEEFGIGVIRNKTNLAMNGEDVFLFGITKVPNSISDFLILNSIDLSEIDFFVMHQANAKMNRLISKKIKISDEKVLSSISEFGNTSSLSIPITLVSNRNKLEGKTINILCSGFGVGLSWGSAYLKLNSNTIFKHHFINE